MKTPIEIIEDINYWYGNPKHERNYNHILYEYLTLWEAYKETEEHDNDTRILILSLINESVFAMRYLYTPLAYRNNQYIPISRKGK